MKHKSLSESFLGRVLTPELACEIEALGICPTGENEEFHTVVVNGPDLKEPMNVLTADIHQEEWGYSALDIALS